MAILRIAGSDATQKIKTACDLVLDGTDDVGDINTFLADYTEGNHVINVYRTIYVTGNITKRLNHSWRGMCGRLKMNDALSTAQYIGGFICEEGNHNNTYIRDFELDGNETGCPDAEATAYSHGITYETYDDPVSPTVQGIATNVRLKNIHSHGWIRSCIVPGPDWIAADLRCGNSRQDHLFYSSGSGNVNVNNLYMYGYSNGALHVSGATFTLNPTPPEDINIKNVTLMECTSAADGTHIHIRSRFAGAGGVMTLPCKRVNIDGLKIRNTVQFNGFTIYVGHNWDENEAGGMCEDISITGLDVSVNSYYVVGKILRSKNIKISGNISLIGNDTDQPMFLLYGGGPDVNNYDFSECGLTSQNYDTHTEHSSIFGINGDKEIKGINLSDVTITNADVFRRMSGTAVLSSVITDGLVYDKDYNPDDITIN